MVCIEYALQRGGHRVAFGSAQNRNVDRRRASTGGKKDPMSEGGSSDSVEEISMGAIVVWNFVEKIRTRDDGNARAWIDQSRERPDAPPMDTVHLTERCMQFLDEEESASGVESRAIGQRCNENDELIRFEK